MRRKQLHHSMRRLVVVAIVAIILPSLVLTLVGLKHTLSLKDELDSSLAEQYTSSARAKIEEIEAQVAALELELRNDLERTLADQHAVAARAEAEEGEPRVPPAEARPEPAPQHLDPRRVAPALDALCRRCPIAEQIFLLEVRQAPANGIAHLRVAMLYPRTPQPTPMVAETLLWTEPFPPLRAKRPARVRPTAKAPGPLDPLERLRNRTLSPATRVRATQAIAAAHFRRRRFDQAIAEYRRLLQTENVALLSPSLALLARYQIALAQSRGGQPGQALEAFLALYADLVGERTGVADASRIDYFSRRAAEHIEALLAKTPAPQDLHDRYAQLLEQERSRAQRARQQAEQARQQAEQARRRARFAAYLRRYVLPRIEGLSTPLSPREKGFRHYWDDELAVGPRAIAYALVRAHSPTQLILGIQLNLTHVRSHILPHALRASRFGQRVAFVVRDRNGGLIFGQPPKGHGPAASEAFRHDSRETIFPAWRLDLIERRPAELRSLASRNVRLFAIITTGMILAILLGVVVTLRGTAHELELSRMKSEFVDNVSHELKTPLALIRMFGETLAMGRVKSAEKTQEYYSIISRESERLTQLINNVLDFSRIEGGRKTYDFRLENIADVIHDTLHAYSYELSKQGFEIETDVPDDLPDTLMDRNAISLVLLNLLSNAVKYSAADRRIRVACAAANGALAIEVADHGIGIDRADLDKIFEKFYRAREEAVTTTRGSGLGLAIVRHSIEAHGGAITVESHKGRGSTFTITLPIRKTLTDGKNPSR